MSFFKCRFDIYIGQIFLSLTKFVENINNIYFSKQVYYKHIFDAISNQPVREAVSYRGLFTAGWFGVRKKTLFPAENLRSFTNKRTGC